MRNIQPQQKQPNPQGYRKQSHTACGFDHKRPAPAFGSGSSEEKERVHFY
jgi:hypothetical protein